MKNRHVMVIIGALFFAFGLIACQAGNEAVQGGTGSVAILLTDGPTTDFDEVRIIIDRIELFSEDRRVTIFEETAPDPAPVDLLTLKDEAVLFALSSGIPAGQYNKIRLHVRSLKLVNGESIVEPKLPGNGKIDLNPRMTFFVDPERILTVEIDIDTHNSIHIVETGSSKLIFRPVVFVNVRDGFIGGKIIKVSGFVSGKGEEAFSLCGIDFLRPAASVSPGDDASRCVEARTGKSSFFDEQGSPTGYAEIAEGDFVTLFGNIWTNDMIQTQEYMDHLILEALVVAKGTPLKLTGIIGQPEEGSNRFPFALDPPGQGISAETISVQYWEETKIFSPASLPADNSSITEGSPATIYGIVSLTEDLLFAEVILLREPAATEMIAGRVTGTIQEDEMTFEMQTDTTTLCAKIGGGATVMTTTQDATGFVIYQGAHFEDLQIGDWVTLSGSFGSGNPECFTTDAVFAFREL